MKNIFLILSLLFVMAGCATDNFNGSRSEKRTEICRNADFELYGPGSSIEFVQICYMNSGTRGSTYEILANGRNPFRVSGAEATDFKVYLADTYSVNCAEFGSPGPDLTANSTVNRLPSRVAECTVSSATNKTAPKKLTFDTSNPGCRDRLNCSGSRLMPIANKELAPIPSDSEYEAIRTSARYTGIQNIRTQAGRTIRNRVFVDRNQVRVEILGDNKSPVELVILYKVDDEFVYFLEPKAKTGTRVRASNPVLMLSDAYLWTALIHQKTLAKRALTRKKIDESFLNGRPIEKYRVTGFPEIQTNVSFAKESKLPIQMELMMLNSTKQYEVVASATWEEIVIGPLKSELFNIPSGYQIIEASDDLR